MSRLPGADFGDAYRLQTPTTGLDAAMAAERMFGRSPAWITGLMKLRNLIVRPLGLKGGVGPEHAADTISFFPVLERGGNYLMVGLDDRHQDFRAIVRVADGDLGQVLTVTTICRTHNLLGRTYLALILPFHRMIVKTMLHQVVLP